VTFAAVVAAVVLSPLGPANLTYPLTYVSSPESRSVKEMQPSSFAAVAETPSAWELVGVVVLVVGGTAWRLLAHRNLTDAPREDATARLRLAVFDAGLVVIVTWMGLSAVRFLPLAVVLLAPLAAAQADVSFRGSRSWVPAAVGAAALAATTLPFAVRVAAAYSPANPKFTDESFFLRMGKSDTLPSGAADFLVDNDVGGHVFADWT
jgi:hypothetical protein